MVMTERKKKRRREAGVMSAREAAWLAWYLCAVSLTLTGLGLFLLIMSQSPAGALGYAGAYVFDYWLENTVVVISFSTVGAVIAPRLPPRNPVGWLFCAIGFVAAMGLFVAEYAIVTLLAEPGSLASKLPGGDAAAWVSSWLWVLHLGLFVFLALLFPDGKPPSPRWQPFAWLIGLVTAAGTVAVALWPETAGGLTPTNSPLSVEAATDVLNPVETIMLSLGLMAVLSLVVRRHSKGVERQQVKWFAYALVWLATSSTLTFILSDTLGLPWLEWVSFVLVMAGVVGLPVAVGIAILKYRLYNIDTLINRTLVYGALTALLVTVYVGGVVLLQGAFRVLIGQESQLAIVASTLAVAALFRPMRRRIQGFIDRRFYRRKYDARKTLEVYSAKLRDETDLDALRDDLMGVVGETIQPAYVSLWLRSQTAPKGEQVD
jgi:hypothetical protein